MRIAIISPAGAVDKEKCEKGIAFLERKSCSIQRGEFLYEKDLWNAGTASQRAEELTKAWIDPQIDVVLSARGGFGCIHILDLLDWGEMQKFSKVLCGHSDLTILHLAFLKKGISYSVSGSMPAVELCGDVDELTESSFFDVIHYKLPDMSAAFNGAKILKKGTSQGRIVPVTLSVMCSLLGSDYMPDLTGDILVLEDVNEEPYRLDAYLSQLRLSGVLQKIGGLVFADFETCGNVGEREEIFSRYSSVVEGPVVIGMPFGHCLPRLSLPVGMTVDFTARDSVTLDSVH